MTEITKPTELQIQTSLLIKALEAQGFTIKTQQRDFKNASLVQAFYSPAGYVAERVFAGSGGTHTVMIGFTPNEQGQGIVYSARVYLDGENKAGNHDFNKTELINSVADVCAMAEHNIPREEISGHVEARTFSDQLKKAMLAVFVPATE
jgi:hypothetical protein